MRLVLLLGLGTCLLLGPAHAGSDPDFSAYRIPDHHAHRFGFSVGSNGHADGRDGASGGMTLRALSGSLGGSARWLRDSDALQWDLGLASHLGGDRWVQRITQPDLLSAGADDQEEASRRGLDEDVSTNLATRLYPWRAPLGLQVTATGTLADNQRWDRNESDRVYDAGPPVIRWNQLRSTEDWQYAEYADVTATAGLGRVRDAGVVYTAWLLEQRWLKDGALKQPLSAAARTRLAQLLETQGDFSIVHDRPAKAFWREAEGVLRDDGALAGASLDAYASQHALDPLLGAYGNGESRRVGWFVGPTIQYSHQHAFRRYDQRISSTLAYGDSIAASTTLSGSSQEHSSSHDGGAGVRAEWHRPLGVRTQLDASASWVADLRGIRRSSSVSTFLQARHRIAERWLMAATANQVRATSRVRFAPQDYWALSFSPEVRYFIEDHWSAGLSASVGRARDRFMGESSRSARYDFSIGYGRGALDATGLIDPVRPLP